MMHAVYAILLGFRGELRQNYIYNEQILVGLLHTDYEESFGAVEGMEEWEWTLI